MGLCRFAFAEALSSLRRAWRSAALAIAMIAGASFILGLLIWGRHAASPALERWAAVSELSIFLRSGASDTQVADLRRLLDAHPAVDATEYVSPEAARARLVTDFPDAKAIVEEMADGGVPASFEVRLAPRVAGQDAAGLVETVRALPAVDDVRYDRDLVQRVDALTNVARGLGGAVGLLLLVMCAMTVTCVVTLAYESRRDEVEILYLVGAPARAVVGPFAVEGLLLALGGVLTALALVVGGVWFVEHRQGALLEALLGTPHLPRPPAVLPLALVCGVSLLGFAAGVMAARGGAARWRQDRRATESPEGDAGEALETPEVADAPGAPSDR